VTFEGRNIVNRADVWVVQRCNGSCLVLKAGAQVRIFGDAAGRDLIATVRRNRVSRAR
jgi:hypothetical protein